MNVESHASYIRGRYHWARVQPERSIEHFRQAVAIDPDNALAWAGIADAQCMLFGGAMQTVPPTQLAPEVRAAALKALELDESLAEPHVSLARVLWWYDRDAVAAERELRRAIQLDPNCADAHFISGLQYACVRRDDEAMVELQRAMQLDPVSCWLATIAGFFMYEIGQEEAGWQQLQKALDLDPELFQLRSLRSVLLTYEGKHSEAIAEAQAGARLSSGLPITRGYGGYALGMAGRRGEARAILDELEDLSRQRYVPASSSVLCWLGLGEHERALEWLEKGYERRDTYLPHLRMNRVFRPLDPDPGFQDLLRRQVLGLNPDGALRLRVRSGEVVTFIAGEIRLRPADQGQDLPTQGI